MGKRVSVKSLLMVNIRANVCILTVLTSTIVWQFHREIASYNLRCFEVVSNGVSAILCTRKLLRGKFFNWALITNFTSAIT